MQKYVYPDYKNGPNGTSIEKLETKANQLATDTIVRTTSGH